MSNSNNRRRGKYQKKCYFTKAEDALPIFYNYNNVTDYIYPFALEYKTDDSFIADYSNVQDGYTFIDENAHPNDKPSILRSSIRQLKSNSILFCERCKRTDSYSSQECDNRQFVANERVLELAIKDNTGNRKSYCKHCGRFVYAHHFKKSKLSLRDVRLSGNPAKLTINRTRFCCPYCNTVVGEEQLYGLQAYRGGAMTPRLAENVLYAQLSSVKREYIAEAYGLSRSQIDRIKSRMIEQMKTASLSHVRRNVKTHASNNIICASFKDSATGHVYYAYFLEKTGNAVFLINILTQAERDAASELLSNSSGLLQHYTNSDAFYLTCFCILAGERHLHGEVLLEMLDQLDARYNQLVTERKHTLNYFSLSNEDAYQLSGLLRRTRNPEDGHILTPLTSVKENRTYPYETEEDGQLNLFSHYENSAETNVSSQHPKIESFVTMLTATLKEHSVTSSDVINTLLYFNPAVIKETDIAFQVSKIQPYLDSRSFYLEADQRLLPTFGASLSCLSHLLKHGLFQDNGDRLISCQLFAHTAHGCSDNNLPCGLECNECPHIMNESDRNEDL